MNELKKDFELYIDTLIKEFKKRKSNKLYYELIDTYNIISEIINITNLDIEFPKELEYELNKKDVIGYNVKSYMEFIENVEYLYDFNLAFSKLYKSINGYSNKPLIEYKQRIELSDSVELAHEFFKSYDECIYNYFDDKLLNNKTFVITNKLNSPTLFGSTFNCNYIIPPYSFIRPSLTVKDYMTIVHETIHNYLFNRLRYIDKKYKKQMFINNLDEVYPKFIELVAMKFLIDNNILVDDINQYFKQNNYSSTVFLKGFNNNLIHYDLNNYQSNEAYSYGAVLAYHFYDNYLIDEELTKRNILNFLLEEQYYDKLYLLDNYGLDISSIINPKILNKYMDKKQLINSK